MDEKHLQGQIQHRDGIRNSTFSPQLPSSRADLVIHCTGESKFASPFTEVFFLSIYHPFVAG